MTPLTQAVAELRLAVAAIERRELPPGASYSDLQDLRTEALAELLDAMDRIDPALGTRVHMVLYPRVNALASGGQLGAKATPELRA